MSDLLGGAGFDQARAQQVVKRLLAYNQYRYERTLSALTERQKHFLDVLPLLYHVNSDKLPGFVGPECPCGMARYQPSKDVLRSASTLSMGFQYQQRRIGNPAIRSLFIMGSCGSLGHSGGSDFDIWVCHDSSLDEEAMALLKNKAAEIERYAETLGIELHFFLMDAKRFIRGERNDLGQEDCGSAQHQLLLDEFYRTSILLAGCYPVWWLVPPDYEHLYDDFVYRLYQQRFASEEDVIDFGGLADISAGEFVGAGMWQLYKAIGSPYKSILKLFLTESYASAYPNHEPLSITLKGRLFDDQVKLEKLDPYLLLYDKLEDYLLQREEGERLELVRRCLYFKANIPMGQSTRRKHWKRDLLRPLILNWGWSDGQLAHLDNRAHWHVHIVMEERKHLVNELIHSYKFLSGFGREHEDETMMSAKDMTLLGHKLYATFDRKPGKIDFINPGISKHIQEDKLSLHLLRQHVRRRIPQMNWSLYTGIARPGTTDAPVKRSANLIELLGWCHVNRIMDRGTNVVMYQGQQHGKDYELKEILNSFQTMPLPDSIVPDFDTTPVPTFIALYVNVFVDPMSHYTRRGISKISNRTDSLGFSALKENLVLTIDQLQYNSWREVLSTRYEGQNALLRVIEDFLNAYPPGSKQERPEIQVHCYCATRSKAIAARVREVLDEMQKCFYGNRIAERRRYVLQIGEQYHLIQMRQGRPMIDHFERAAHLFKKLASPQPFYSQVVLDSQALKGTIMHLICKHSKPGVLQVFYIQEIGQQQQLTAQIYLLDERGSIIRWRTPMYNEAALINPIHHFLRQVEYRQNRHRHRTGNKTLRERPIEYYEVQLPTKEESLRLRPIRPKEGLGKGRYFDVHAQVDYDAQNRLGFTLFCEQREFSQLEHGEQVYKALVRYLVGLRKHNKPYPVYITDIAISDRLHNRHFKQVLQTATYLDYKHKLETRLNQALAELYPA